MKDTPTKWGIKAFVILADAKNGYVKTSQVYTRRTVEGRSDVGQRLQPWLCAFSIFFSILMAISVFSQKVGGGHIECSSKKTFFFFFFLLTRCIRFHLQTSP